MSENNGNQIVGRGMTFKSRLRTKHVEFPEFGLTFILRELTVGQLKGLQPDDLVGLLGRMIVDENGQRVYQTPEEMAELEEMQAVIGAQLIVEATALNGSSRQAVEDALKNLKASPNADSATA